MRDSKEKHKPKKRSSPPQDSRVLFLALLGVVLAAIVLRIYKAHTTGVIYDEAYSFIHFGRDIHKALTLYINPNNNHVINSVLMCFAYKNLKVCEHFIRIHSVLFGILFTLSAAYIVHKTINSSTLKILLLALIILNWFVFDLSILARGYSIALGAIYFGIAVIVRLLSKKIKYIYRWVPIIIIVLVNFLAFGSMLSCIFTLFSVNIVFVLVCSSCIYRDTTKRLVPILTNLGSISLLSVVSSYLLYKSIYKDIIKAQGTFGKAGFAEYMKLILVDSFRGRCDNPSSIIYVMSVLLVSLGLAFLAFRFYKINRENGWRQSIEVCNPRVFVILVTLVTITVMFIHRVVLKMSLGAMRNSVFLVPLVLLSSGILLDWLWQNTKNKKLLSPLIRSSVIVVMLLLALRNLPSAHAVEVYNWDRQSMSGPLLRRLKKLDPNRIWKIGLSKETRYLNLPLIYYTQFDYKYKIASPKDWDIYVLYKTEKPIEGRYLNEDYFRKFNCYVVVNPKSAAFVNR